MSIFASAPGAAANIRSRRQPLPFAYGLAMVVMRDHAQDYLTWTLIGFMFAMAVSVILIVVINQGPDH